MPKSARAALFAVAALFILPAATAGAAVVVTTGPVDVHPAPVQAPSIHRLDCNGGTGSFGCGPGFHWTDGWRGFGCYPC